MKLKPPKPGRTEKQVAAQVVQAAAMLGIELKRRNVGLGTNPSGRPVRFAEPGDGDYYCVLPDGRHMDLEIKHEGFDPSKLRGEKRAHFERQLAKLRRTNELGGVGVWLSDSTQFFHLIRRVSEGWRVEFDEVGFPWLVSPDECKKTGL